jgi:lysophospholipase L1-like esterase
MRGWRVVAACALLGGALCWAEVAPATPVRAAAHASRHSSGRSSRRATERPANSLPTCPASRWIESWYAAPSDDVSVVDARLKPFAHGLDQTLRIIITPHYGGSLIRVRLSNLFGSSPATISEISIAHSQGGAALVAGSSRQVLFGGNASVTIPPGGEAVSDPVRFSFGAFQNLAVSLYVPGGEVPTEHFAGRQISYGTSPLAGNFTQDASGAPFTQTTTARYFVSGLDVQAPGDSGTVVTFGDSITDGYQGPLATEPEDTSTLNLNARYPDWLARRILAAHLPLSVANAGISGNRILQNGEIPMFGPSGLSRFTRDALEIPGVSTIVILEGINDIGQSDATAGQIIGGLTRLVEMARAAHVRVLLGTLTPAENPDEPVSSIEAAENSTREAVNRWIAGQHVANGYIDFDAAVRDPADPDAIDPPYNGGDWLHFDPNGYRAMANAVPLSELRAVACAVPERRS